MSQIFGKRGSQKSESKNLAYADTQRNFNPMVQQGLTGSNMIQQLLQGNPSGFNDYKRATGFDGLMEEGSRGITGNAAAASLLRSGYTGQALSNYANTMQNQYANNYLQGAQGMVSNGLNAGQLIGSTGQVSNQVTKQPKKGLLDYGLAGASLFAGGKG
jgi:hypothetical protein